MFILQTTIAVLVAFLALTAYKELRIRIEKGKSRRKDLEAPASPNIASKDALDDGRDEDGWREPDVSKMDLAIWEEMERNKLLYFKLHNLEHYPEILPECHHLLVSLLAETLVEASKHEASSILSIREFSRDKLSDFLTVKDTQCTDDYEAYVTRRRSGGPREIFSTEYEAKWWLKQAAPVKYVDGAWLGHINKISTPFKYRKVTKNAWQVMSEELGDGDLEKNHVQVYRELMQVIDSGLPDADSKDFIHPRHGLNEARCWKAAMAQLLISLFPIEFLPEALGFNMAYESLPLHLLKTVKELRELRLNPYYFELHISIDNGSSGHAAMAMETVIDYIDMVRRDEGEEVAHLAWKRVQAGFILAEGLPTTPESPSLKEKNVREDPFPRNDTEAALLQIFKAKAPVAHKIHCNSRLKIGRQSLVDWLEPKAFKNLQWQKDFLDDLGNCKPWVIKGNIEKSRLVKEMSWGGKMFGSFMQSEVEILKEWIATLSVPAKVASVNPMAYYDFVGKPHTKYSQKKTCTLADYPVYADYSIHADFSSRLDQAQPHLSAFVSDCGKSGVVDLDLNTLDVSRLLPLWFASLGLLESLPSVPVRASNTFGSAIVRVLRAQSGFSDEGPGVAGMDEVRRTDDGQATGIVELGLEMCSRAGLGAPQNLQEVINIGHVESKAFASWMIGMGMQWLVHRDLLVGMAWAFMEMHVLIAERDDGKLLSVSGKNTLGRISEREKMGLEVCRKEIEDDDDDKRSEEFARGVDIARREIKKCYLLA